MLHLLKGFQTFLFKFLANKSLSYLGLKAILFLFFIGKVQFANAQKIVPDSTDFKIIKPNSEVLLVVKNIFVSGNKKTKNKIILREMQIHTGDTLSMDKLSEELETAREFIYNTKLFEKVSVKPQLLNNQELNIIITVKERWYTYPIPFLELADRSFNEWVHTYNADLRRISYGVQLTTFNFSGQRDKVSLDLINGFKRKIGLEYSLPYFNKKLTTGVKVGVGFSQTKEIPYATDANNKLLYYENGGYEKNDWKMNLAFTKRKKLKRTESFSIEYHHIKVSDSIVLKYNPNFFNSSSATQDFVDLEYNFNYDDLDNIGYPLKGHSYSMLVKKRGLGFTEGLNLFSIQPSYKKYFSMTNGWYSSIRLTAEIKLPFSQPYYNLRALGYGENFIRGLEYHVIDGVAFGLVKFDLKKKIFQFQMPTIFKSPLLKKIPITILAKTYSDQGYVYSQQNLKLNNKFLYSAGVGIDIITLYDFSISVEYSFNQLGQKGIFLHLLSPGG
ncbi:MAG: POTRA domain-containing protein [Ginsengibacter sp.]